jgi:hypothetical protein
MNIPRNITTDLQLLLGFHMNVICLRLVFCFDFSYSKCVPGILLGGGVKAWSSLKAHNVATIFEAIAYKCGSLDISQFYLPKHHVTGIAVLTF